MFDMINRRKLLQTSIVSSGILTIPLPLRAMVQGMVPPPIMPEEASPFLIAKENTSLDFNGDDIERPHELLWDKEGYIARKGGRPPVSEEVNVLIAGGGLSGLLTAYYLKALKPVVLEQCSQFGGNSKGEVYKGTRYNMGAAYFCVPEPGGEIDQLLTDLNLRSELKHEKETYVNYLGKVIPDFWEGHTDPEHTKLFTDFNQLLKNILEKSYPEIPYIEGSDLTREEFNQLDALSFLDWLKQNKIDLHPHVHEYLQLYAWSSFGGSLEEVSAAQMINFIASETEGILTLPGGNAAITHALVKKLYAENSEGHMRPGCMLLDVRYDETGCTVCYENAGQKLISVRAKKVVMSCPKFVVKKVIDQLPRDQFNAIEKIQYRGYIVANILSKKKLKTPSYELYCLQNEVPPSPRAMSQNKRSFTDVCFSTWANNENSPLSVITLFKALPFDGARQFLFSPFAHQKNMSLIRKDLAPLLATLDLTEDDIEGIRLTRWGHSMPLSATGMLSSGLAETACRTIQNKIFFANQDNWVNPAFECAHGVALATARSIAMNE